MDHATIAGRVVDATSLKPIAGAHVTIIRVVETPQGAFGGESRQGLTDASGRFVFERRIPGRHRIDVEKSGFAPSFDPFNSTLFDLEAGQSLSDVQIALKRGGVLSGGVRDDTGEPQPDIMVSAMRLVPQGRQFGLEMIQGGVGHTNDLGEFRIANLHEGEYFVVASEQHHGGPFGVGSMPRAMVAAPTYYPGTRDRSSAHALSIGEGQTVAGLWFSMISSPAFDVSGEVVDASGAPVGGAMVTLMPSFRLDTPPSHLMVDADSDGSFRIGGVMPGTYHVSATAPMDASGGGVFFDMVHENVMVDSSGGGDSIVVIEPASSPQRPKVVVENGDVTGLRVVANSG